MRWSQLLRSSESLPFFTNEPKSSRIGFLRRWRSLPRLKRLVIITMLLSFFCILFVIASPHIEMSNKAPFDVLQSREINNDEIEIMSSLRGVSHNRSSVPSFSGPTNDRQRAVVAAFKHAWEGYRKYAWGHDQLKPISGGYLDWFDTGLTIVDALDTAIIMGLKEEAEQGKAWIRDFLSFEKDRYVNVFETTIRTLGGLLSAFHLTGDRMFVEKAEDLAGRLLSAFSSSKSAIPLSDVNLKTRLSTCHTVLSHLFIEYLFLSMENLILYFFISRKAKPPRWSVESSLSEVTSLQLEFRDLSRVTGKKIYEETAFKVSKHIHKIGCKDKDGLCEMFLNSNTGQFRTGMTITFGARADSYYEYLLKQWIQTGKSIDWLFSDYITAMESMQVKLLRYSVPSNLAFVGELLSGSMYSPKMDHLACFLAGTLALGSINGAPSNHITLAKVILFEFNFIICILITISVKDLGKTCQKMYVNPTGLAPEIAHFNMMPGVEEDISIKPLDAHSLLRPEAIESWFYLYRITGDKIYQDWGWDAFNAIEKYAKVQNGYSSVKSVKKIPVSHSDLMETFFLAETLKYLYLLFADDQINLFPLDDWVFNTEAHPLPVYSG
ncbi:glycosyl hydrolase family 47 [Dictyocaulus viviparus]|uniref:alpha-1,2-Mannosidase n=1 Tax=Dictyocaulus viviparus TaxID=29172 RepID=A0A0D8Y2U5_DICVI|nr:glycosyl hydrolase family 47 [Dictyocaulus viviparus]